MKRKKNEKMPHRRKRQCPPTIYDSDSSNTYSEGEEIKIEEESDSDSDEINQPCTSATAIRRENAKKLIQVQEKRNAALTKKQRNAERMRRSREENVRG